MPRTLYLHVGPRKTGTSAIQGFLARHDNSVVFYPKLGGGGAGAHHELVRAFSRKLARGRRRTARLERLFIKLEAEARHSHRNVVISSESLDMEEADVGAFARALKRRLSGPMEVEIIVACREHFARAASWYNKRMRGTGDDSQRNLDQRRLPDEFLLSHAQEICYAPLVNRLRATGFKVTALNYHPPENWTQRFLLHIGFASDQIPEIGFRHVGLSTKALIANVAANRALASSSRRRDYLKAFKRMDESKSPSQFIFSRDCAKKADALFSGDRKFLEEEYGIRFNPPDPETAENMFYITKAELDEIAAAAMSVGSEGKDIAAYARRYLREDAPNAANGVAPNVLENGSTTGCGRPTAAASAR